jgi:uncharacterized protein YbjQ (UPF0145 family)
MDTPFPGDKNPFLVPYSPPAPADQGVKPFAAVDLAPPSGQSGQVGPRLQAPQASPFLDKDYGRDAGKPQAGRPLPGPASLPDPLHPIPANSLSQVFAPTAPGSTSGFPFASAPAFAAKTPAPAPIPAPPAGVDYTPVLPRAEDFVAVAPALAAPFTAPPTPLASAVPPMVPPPAAIPIAAPAAPRPSPVPAPKAAPIAPMASSGPEASAALRASATPRRGSASEMIAKTDLAMTDADSPEAIPLHVTSGPSLDGRRISAYLGVVSSEIVIPMDVLFRNPAPYGELHRIKAAEEELQRVKRKACEELEARARARGADGIIAVALQYCQIDAVAFLCAATGTAVKLHPGP